MEKTHIQGNPISYGTKLTVYFRNQYDMIGFRFDLSSFHQLNSCFGVQM